MFKKRMSCPARCLCNGTAEYYEKRHHEDDSQKHWQQAAIIWPIHLCSANMQKGLDQHVSPLLEAFSEGKCTSFQDVHDGRCEPSWIAWLCFPRLYLINKGSL